MSKEFWDKRYSEQEFTYSTDLTQFFKKQIDILYFGKILFIMKIKYNQSKTADEIKFVGVKI